MAESGGGKEEVAEICRGKEEVAETTSHETTPPVGYKALQENFADLVQTISQVSVLQDLAPKAYSKSLITQGQMTMVVSATGVNPVKQASNFLISIQNRVKRDKKAFGKFVAILKSEPAYENLVALLGAT